MTDERYGDVSVQVNRGGLTVRRLEFTTPRVPTPVCVALTNRYFWQESGTICVDVWELNKIGMARNDFNNFHLVQTITLDDKQRGLYFDEDMAYRLWTPSAGIVLEISQQYITVQLPAIADAASIDDDLVATQCSPAGELSGKGKEIGTHEKDL